MSFVARNHPQQVQVNGVDTEVDDRATHPVDFAPLNDRYAFTIDVAAAAHNTKCERYFDRAADGLIQPWSDESVWCNPPYSDITPWIRKAWDEHQTAHRALMFRGELHVCRRSHCRRHPPLAVGDAGGSAPAGCPSPNDRPRWDPSARGRCHRRRDAGEGDSVSICPICDQPATRVTTRRHGAAVAEELR